MVRLPLWVPSDGVAVASALLIPFVLASLLLWKQLKHKCVPPLVLKGLWRLPFMPAHLAILHLARLVVKRVVRTKSAV